MRENIRKNGTSSPCGETTERVQVVTLSVVMVFAVVLALVAASGAEPVQPTWRQLVREHLAACHDGRADVGRCERSEAALRLRIEEEGR